MASKSLTAIIAEDVPEMQVLLKRALERYGCTIVAIEDNGEKALEKIEKLSPDMVFLDIEMPGLTGLEILEKIKSRQLHTFAVIVSGKCDFEYLKTSIEKGAQGYVVKPYTTEKIGQMIHKYEGQTN